MIIRKCCNRLIIFSLALAIGSSAALAANTQTLAIGDVAPTAPSWPSFVAITKGFYHKEGLIRRLPTSATWPKLCNSW